jgi:hypothetical protein
MNVVTKAGSRRGQLIALSRLSQRFRVHSQQKLSRQANAGKFTQFPGYHGSIVYFQSTSRYSRSNQIHLSWGGKESQTRLEFNDDSF